MSKLKWRVQSDDQGGFDEVVVGPLLHAEMMNDRDIFISVGPLRIWASVVRGKCVIMNEEDDRGPR